MGLIKIKVDNIEVRGTGAINFINERLSVDLAGTGNSLVVLSATAEAGGTVFEVETNFYNLLTVTEYFVKFIGKRKRWIVARNEEQAEEPSEETAEDIIDCTGVNFNNIQDVKKVVKVETLPEKIQEFIFACDSFAFNQYELILYKDRVAKASASFIVTNKKADINSMGAGALFQWNSTNGFL